MGAQDVAAEAVREAGKRIGERLIEAAKKAKDEVKPEDVARIDAAVRALIDLEARKVAGETGLDVEIAGHRSVLSSYAFVAASVARSESINFATDAAEIVAQVAGAAAKAFARSLGVPVP